MNTEQARALTDTALEQLATALQAGTSEHLARYLRAMGAFHRYSFSNLMLIIAQRPDASRVAGFHTWKSLGRSVRKGEKGIGIVAPMMMRTRRDDPAPSTPAPSSPTRDGDGPDAVLRFRAVHVFDVEQTDGEPLPEANTVSGEPGEALERLRMAITARGITLEVRDLGGAEGVSCGGRIAVRPGLSPAEEFTTLVHEFAHELLHRGDPALRPSKVVRETEAEAVAFAVCHAVGLDAHAASADYIKLYERDNDTLLASLDRIQHTASAILTAIAPPPPAAPPTLAHEAGSR